MYEDKVVCMFVVVRNYAGRPLRRRSCFLPYLVQIRSLTRCGVSYGAVWRNTASDTSDASDTLEST